MPLSTAFCTTLSTTGRFSGVAAFSWAWRATRARLDAAWHIARSLGRRTRCAAHSDAAARPLLRRPRARQEGHRAHRRGLRRAQPAPRPLPAAARASGRQAHHPRQHQVRPLRPLVPAAPRAAHLARRRHDGRPQRPRGHPEAQEADSAAPRGLDARRRLVGPRPHGALTLCVPLGFVLRV